MATERKQSSGSRRGKKSKHSSPFIAIKEFRIPTHSWTMKGRHLKHLNIQYCEPEHVQRMGRPLLRMTVTQHGSKCGYLFVPVRELFTLSHAFQQDVTRNPGGIPACYKDVTGIPGKFLVVNLAGNTAKNYQESTKTPEGCYQEFLVKCKDVRGNYQDSLYLD
ncbi:hypothetical protein JOM56_012531 [Amanita muscaria]